MAELIDIRNYDIALDTINAILNNRKRCELALEVRKGKDQIPNLLVIELNRSVKSCEYLTDIKI